MTRTATWPVNASAQHSVFKPQPETRTNIIKVPRGPFLEAGSGRQAYVLEDGIAVLRPIEVGSLSVGEVEIVSGLEIGDQIIISDTARFQGAERILLRD